MKKFAFIGFGLALVALQSCATGADRKLDEKLTHETESIHSRKDVQSETNRMLESSNLTKEQKENLVNLKNVTGKQLDENYQQSVKLRALLVRDVLGSNYNPDEVDLIKKRMRNLETDKLNIMFDAVDKANTILGRQAVENPAIVEGFLMDRPERY